MKKALGTLILLTVLLSGTQDTFAKDIYAKRKTVKNDGPVKNIPPPVMNALKEALAAIDPYFNPTLATSTVTWTRDKNVFHVIVSHIFCSDDEPFAYRYSASITANGHIIISSLLVAECIKIPPDSD